MVNDSHLENPPDTGGEWECPVCGEFVSANNDLNLEELIEDHQKDCEEDNES